MTVKPTAAEVKLAESVLAAAGAQELTTEQVLGIRRVALNHAATLSAEAIKRDHPGQSAESVVQAAMKFEKFLLGTPNTRTEDSSV